MTSLQGRSAAARRSMSKALFWAVGRYRRLEAVRLGRILQDQGQGSFGWSILLFAMINMLPLPLGSNVITALPLLLLTGQMALGFPYVRLPAFISRRRVPRRAFQRVILRFKPLFRRIERVIRPRLPQFFTAKAERLIGGLLFVVSAALFLPIPFSGLFSAAALAVSAMALIERDGVVMIVGLVMGVVAIVVTVTAATAIVIGANSFI
ncbi:exopolysaccharide biosynthesis protein [Pelagibius sp.]|uniref:exopolysaccharide biosynthesis protein n=1 Tax=Pelagibius sp. TaxID=1931238 RepID=UPI003B50275D